MEITALVFYHDTGRTWFRFYKKHESRTVTPAEKDRLFGKYRTISGRQIEASAVRAGPAMRVEFHT